MEHTPARRDVLRLAGLAGVAATVAACTPSTGRGGSAASGSTTASTPIAAQGSTTASASGAPTSATASASASSSASASASRSARSSLPVLGSGRQPRYTRLAQQLTGTLAQPGQSAYRPQQLLYNPRYADTTKPQAIAYCKHTADVAACVRFAAGGGAPLRMRNGGHSYGGWSSGPGLVVDLAAMNAVHVDRSAMTATIGAGALLGDVYAALGANGVSIGAGSCATVGITGLTLGGGIGLLSRQYGLTCDQLVSAVVVTADGATHTVSAAHHPDLFWALRGGGGSFGAVTSLTFKVRPAPTMQSAYLTWDGADAVGVLDAWQHWLAGLPRQLMTSCRFTALPQQGLSAHVAVFWTGSGSPERQIARLLRTAPKPHPRPGYGKQSYVATMLAAAGCFGTAQQCITAALSAEQRQPATAASSIMRKPLPRKAISALADAVGAGGDVPGIVSSNVQFDALGGAVSDLAAGDTAFPWRDAIADVQYDAVWHHEQATVDPGRYDRLVHKARATLTPYVGGSGYSNYADPQLRDYGTAYWGPNLGRLRTVKKAYDPHNVFSWPQSVPL